MKTTQQWLSINHLAKLLTVVVMLVCSTGFALDNPYLDPAAAKKTVQRNHAFKVGAEIKRMLQSFNETCVVPSDDFKDFFDELIANGEYSLIEAIHYEPKKIFRIVMHSNDFVHEQLCGKTLTYRYSEEKQSWELAPEEYESSLIEKGPSDDTASYIGIALIAQYCINPNNFEFEEEVDDPNKQWCCNWLSSTQELLSLVGGVPSFYDDCKPSSTTEENPQLEKTEVQEVQKVCSFSLYDQENDQLDIPRFAIAGQIYQLTLHQSFDDPLRFLLNSENDISYLGIEEPQSDDATYYKYKEAEEEIHIVAVPTVKDKAGNINAFKLKLLNGILPIEMESIEKSSLLNASRTREIIQRDYAFWIAEKIKLALEAYQEDNNKEQAPEDFINHFVKELLADGKDPLISHVDYTFGEQLIVTMPFDNGNGVNGNDVVEENLYNKKFTYQYNHTLEMWEYKTSGPDIRDDGPVLDSFLEGAKTIVEYYCRLFNYSQPWCK
jgi:hypothetical protein